MGGIVAESSLKAMPPEQVERTKLRGPTTHSPRVRALFLGTVPLYRVEPQALFLDACFTNLVADESILQISPSSRTAVHIAE